MENEIRMLRKRFKCIKCGVKLSKLVASTQRNILCENCGHLATEISEEEYISKTRDQINQNYRITFDGKSNKYNTSYDKDNHRTDVNDKNIHNLHGDTTKKIKHEIKVNKNEGDNDIDNNNNNSYSSRTATNSNNPRQNNLNNNYNRNNSPHNRHYSQSNSGRTDNNSNIFSNIFRNVYDSFGRVFNAFDHNNHNSNQFNNSNNSNHYRPRDDSNREGFNGSGGSQGGFFNDFFSNNGISFPFVESPFMGRIFRHHFDEDIFDPNFEFFGSTFNNFFRDNYSSNFRSNFMNGGDIGEIFDIIRNQTDNNKKRKTTSEKSLNNLKRFKMNSKYCKKSSNGNLEFPNCCICISDVVINEETVLLPCGHIFHMPCVLEWLKKNNTCPVCRFEL